MLATSKGASISHRTLARFSSQLSALFLCSLCTSRGSWVTCLRNFKSGMETNSWGCFGNECSKLKTRLLSWLRAYPLLCLRQMGRSEGATLRSILGSNISQFFQTSSFIKFRRHLPNSSSIPMGSHAKNVGRIPRIWGGACCVEPGSACSAGAAR